MNITVPMQVSAHAVEQFQQRIASLSEPKARHFILTGIHQAANIKLLPDGNTLRIRTRSPFPFAFRAFCVFDEERGGFVVTTIVRGEGNAARQRKRRARRRAGGSDGAPTTTAREVCDE